MAKTIPSVSVAIASYEVSGMGRRYLSQTLESIASQNLTAVEVVVSDDSRDDEIESECKTWSGELDIRYLQNNGPRMTPSKNFNRAISYCSGSIVKVLCQDDLLAGPTSLQQTVEALQGHNWLVSAYAHIDEKSMRIGSHTPTLNSHIERNNTIGSHSGLAFRRDIPYELFNERLFWRMDCELYRRMFEKFGSPFLLTEESVCVRQWKGQSTHKLIGFNDRIREWLYVVMRHPRKLVIDSAV